MFAPVVFRDAGSSFGLWGTLSSAGRGFAPAMCNAVSPADAVPWVDANYTFLHVPVLYPSVAADAGLSGNWDFYKANMHKILAWLKEH